jgi:hypothetical protein
MKASARRFAFRNPREYNPAVMASEANTRSRHDESFRPVVDRSAARAPRQCGGSVRHCGHQVHRRSADKRSTSPCSAPRVLVDELVIASRGERACATNSNARRRVLELTLVSSSMLTEGSKLFSWARVFRGPTLAGPATGTEGRVVDELACLAGRARLKRLTALFPAYVDDSFSILGIVSRCEWHDTWARMFRGPTLPIPAAPLDGRIDSSSEPPHEARQNTWETDST